MPLLSSSSDPAERVRRAIEQALPDAQVEVDCTAPGHFEVRVVAETFQDCSRVEQHRAVYAAIAPLMEGPTALVHAVDRLETKPR